MTNDEFQMRKEIRMTKPELGARIDLHSVVGGWHHGLEFDFAGFGFPSEFAIRISDFFRHLAFGIPHSDLLRRP